MASDTITCKTILRSSVVKLTCLYIEGGEEEAWCVVEESPDEEAWCVVEESPDEEAWCVVEESPDEEALFPSLLPSNPIRHQLSHRECF